MRTYKNEGSLNFEIAEMLKKGGFDEFLLLTLDGTEHNGNDYLKGLIWGIKGCYENIKHWKKKLGVRLYKEHRLSKCWKVYQLIFVV